MKSIKLISTLLISIVLISSVTLQAQNRFDALRYSQTSPGFDATSLSLSGASFARYNGFGSIYVNPAVAGLAEKSEFTFGLGSRSVSEETTYLNTLTKFDDQEYGISNLGYIFRFPTETGSLVLGGGYNQIANFNRATSINAFNGENSIIDYFLISPGDQYFETAFNTFAIEYDEEFDEYYNSLRADFNYRGMNQYAELKERGQMGEFNVFMSTEFQQNFYVGGSIGIVMGDYRYKRIFLEEDLNGNYVGAALDINNLLNEDRIDATIRGINARIGVLYIPIEGLNLGLSYTTKTKMDIDETYSTMIRTEFYTSDEDGFNTYEDVYEGEISYTVTRPSVLSGGIGLNILSIAELDVSAELMNYSNIEMGGIGVIYDRDENQAMLTNFEDVLNLRIGLSLNASDKIRPRVGYALNPSPRKGFNGDITYYSVGASFILSPNISMDAGFQFASWDDELNFYDYGTASAFSTQNVEKVQGMVGFTFKF